MTRKPMFRFGVGGYLRGGLIVLGLICSMWVGWVVPIPWAQEKTPPEQADEPSVAAMMHQFHLEDLGMECTECHRRQESALPGQELVFSVRPNHAVCEDCHDEVTEPKKPEGPICQICHARGETKMGIFPSGENTLTRFSHVTHVDPKGRRNAQGLRLDCALCHVADATKRTPPMPGHTQCSACHANAATAEPIIAAEGGSEACATCHMMPKIDAFLAKRLPGAATSAPSPPRASGDHAAASASPWVTAKGVPYRDIVSFKHDHHVKRRDGKPIDCVVCHSAVLKRHEFGQHDAVPTMQQCTVSRFGEPGASGLPDEAMRGLSHHYPGRSAAVGTPSRVPQPGAPCWFCPLSSQTGQRP